jgi:hypothetical protein
MGAISMGSNLWLRILPKYPIADQTLARSHCGNEAVNIISIVGEGILVGGA